MKQPRSSRRRLALAIVIIFAVVGVFSVKLVDIQVVRAAELNKQSLDKRAITLTTYAPRGSIVDANGVVLADSVTRFNVTAAPVNAQKGFERTDKNKQKQTFTTSDAANQIAAITKQDPAVVLAAIMKDPTSNYALLTKAIDTATMRKVRALDIPWISFESEPIRTYPDGAVAGNLVGFMGTDGPQIGLEKTQNACLAATDGTSTYERGADGVQIPGSTVTTKQAKPGGTLGLTIDADLNWYVQQAIAEQGTAIGAVSATGIVVRVKDGHILALADWPSVDPNNVNATPTQFLQSKAFTDYYEPGSTMKAISASMLIDSGTATPTSPGVTVNSSWTTPEGHTIHDATGHPTEKLTLTGVLEQSSNVGISQLGIAVPQKVRADYLKKFGFGVQSPIGFQGESSRPIPALPWNDVTKYDMLYGQGIAVTAVQLAGAYEAIANGGVKIPLTLTTGCTHPDGTVTDVPSTTGTRVISEQSSKTVVNMLESVVQGGELSKTLKIPGYRVAAKSGTAEVAANGRYTSDRIVSLAGIAPADDPQYIVLVTYTKPAIMKSSAAAAPTFHKIMSQVLTKYRVPPSTTPSTFPATNW